LRACLDIFLCSSSIFFTLKKISKIRRKSPMGSEEHGVLLNCGVEINT
jgi:hypothetical protein